MRKLASFFAILGVTAAIAVSCSSDKDPIVAEVDGEKIPVSIIHDFFDKGGWTFESYESELETKRAAIDSVIDYKLLVKGAYENNLSNDPEIEKLVASERAGFLFDAMYRKDLAPAAAVTEADVREFYDKLKEERHVLHILVATSREADSVVAELDKGADFGTIARMISLDQSSAVRGGDLGWLNWGTAVDSKFREAFFAMSAGETSKPLKTDYGYHIIRMLETRPVELKPYEELATFIKQALVSRRSSDTEAAFLRSMEEKAAVQINPEATALLLERLDMYYPDSLNRAKRPDNYFPNLEVLKPFEQQMVIASYTGGEVTIEDYINKLAAVPDAARPRFDNEPMMKKTIFQLELKNIVEYEAEQRKIQDTEEYQKRVNDFREGLMVDKFTRSVLGRQIDVSEDEIVEYYNTHLDEFTIPQEYHIWEIQRPLATDLGPIIEELRSGADFGALAAKKTVRTGMQATKGDLGFVQKSRFPQLWEAATKVRMGEISDIVVNDDGSYSVIKVIDVKQPVIVPVEQVTSQVQASVMDLKRSSATVDWLKARREKASIEIHAEVLERTIDKTKYDKKG